ncbi:hypothetical protein THF5G08_10016 [Vibrio jasicida]|nr:hypothetical protein THF5G08_10016 [Vibrio jasicida]
MNAVSTWGRQEHRKNGRSKLVNPVPLIIERELHGKKGAVARISQHTAMAGHKSAVNTCVLLAQSGRSKFAKAARPTSQTSEIGYAAVAGHTTPLIAMGGFQNAAHTWKDREQHEETTSQPRL